MRTFSNCRILHLAYFLIFYNEDIYHTFSNARKKRDINIRGQINHVLLIFYKLSINYLTAHFKQTLKNIKQRHMGLDLLTVHSKKISRKRIQVKNNWCLLPNFFDFHHTACNLVSNSATKTVSQQSPATCEWKPIVSHQRIVAKIQ